ncbi:RHS repeat-associated core domain-containing protein [Streptomyces sp. NPDC006540]|uniref:RHS repeat-associated core domain-containing protein n=1 Tax=Streptomyces sp. NPDC006540 TaxID=3155353 RepID=UPI0033A93927
MNLIPRHHAAHRPAKTWPKRIAALTGFTLLPGLLAPVVFAADLDPLGKPKITHRPDKVTSFVAKTDPETAALLKKTEAADRTAMDRATKHQNRTVTWPTAGTATLTHTRGQKEASAAPGQLPLTLTAPSASGKKKQKTATSLTARVLDQRQTAQLGIKGVALAVTGPTAGGSARLGIDYSAFASAYGGDWAGRLQLRTLPACALIQPPKAICRTGPVLPSTNERKNEKLTADLSFAPAAQSTSPSKTQTQRQAAAGQTMVLALAAGTQSGGGNYKATPLASSSTWASGGSSGTFTWSQPLRVPPAAAGPKPTLNISYDSGSVDGRTSNTNNQGSQIGEGFDLTSSYIERKYGSCEDDGQDAKHDQCWKYENASLVLNGSATELVKDDTSGQWRLKNDDDSKVIHGTGAGNGDDNGEYWTVITGDGTRYTFGKHKLPGWRTDDPATTGTDPDDTTDSTWLVPVFGDDSGEPGYDKGSSFSSRSLVQAWRWNLDYVVDTHGNAMSYFYGKETNYYAKNGDTTNSAYTRGGYLKRIEYGQRSDTMYTAPAAQKITFIYKQRCDDDRDCTSLTEDTRDNWPDVPYDAICISSNADCAFNVSPAYFTRYRLTTINTYAWNAAAAPAAYAHVDTWTLKQKYLDPGDTGDSSDQSLWLDEIKHTGRQGTDLSLDAVKFLHEMRPNRVDGATDDILSLERPRLRQITSETGAQTIVDYMPADCVAGQPRAKVDENTSRCYPVYWSPNGEKTPILDWFQKFPVSGVRTIDATGGSDAVVHTYQYSGGGAWHYNEDPFTPEDERTWSNWRGYERVTHLTGNAGYPDRPQLKTVTVYMRGMHGDRVLGPDGKTPDPVTRKTTTVTGIAAPLANDYERYAGVTRESVTYNGTTEVSGTVNSIWTKKTATQHKSYADTAAYMVRTAGTTERTTITSSGTPTSRKRTINYTYDHHGMVETAEDRGNDAVSGDEKCTRNWYARNTDADTDPDKPYLTSLVSRTRTAAAACSVADSDLDLPADTSRPGDVISDTATVFDDTAATAWTTSNKPSTGEPVWTGRAKGYNTEDAPSWQKTGTISYDTLGRPLVAKDTNGATTATTAYTPTAGGPLTSMTVANAKGHMTTTNLNFASGAALKVTDPNNKITESEYDSLGRITKVWLPNRLKVLGATPNYTYDYEVHSASMPWVATGSLKPDASGYNTTVELYDSLLRPRQVQTPSPLSGRLIGLTQYDDRGLVTSTQSDIWDNTALPNGDNPAQTDGGQAPVQTDTTYDGASRVIKAVTKTHGTARWTIHTAYLGDTVTTTAPDGGQATAVVTNALGQTTERREYGSPQPTGTDFTTTTYTYTPVGQPQTMTGPDKAKWTYSYDLFGRKTSMTDPDSGTSTTSYDALDRIASTTDARSRTLTYAYDELGRKTGMWQTSNNTDANKLAAWTFDTLAKGQQDTAVRYEGGVNQTGSKAYTKKVTSYDGLYNVTGNQLQLPTTDPLVAAGVPSTLSFTAGYNADGSLNNERMPAVGGLAAETVAYTTNALGGHIKTQGITGYLQGAAFSPHGDLSQLTLGVDGTLSADQAYINYTYEAGTRRLTSSFVTDDVHGYMPQELKFTQDDAGNVTSIFDATTQGGTTKADYQCFTYDGHSRLTEAWTPTVANCDTSSRTTANIGGAAPYWTSYGYTAAGQRGTEKQHSSTGDIQTDYTYGSPAGQPHTLISATTGTATKTYTYDKTGNTLTRPGVQANQTLTWNTEGKLATATEPAAGTKPATATGYLYDADGELLIRRTLSGDGDTVLYIGGTEVRLTVNGSAKTLAGTRYYTANGQTIAVRTATNGTPGTQLKFLAADHHGTSSVALDADSYAVTKRYTAPFGAERGPKTTWVDDKSFLGKTDDKTTGLTHIGARQYDPTLGQFISVDPLLIPEQHESLNGYSYANQRPTTTSDPTGLCEDPGNGRCHQSSTTGSGKGPTYDPAFEENPGVTYPSESGGDGKPGTLLSDGGVTGWLTGPSDADGLRLSDVTPGLRYDAMGTPCYSGSYGPGCAMGSPDLAESRQGTILDIILYAVSGITAAFGGKGGATTRSAPENIGKLELMAGGSGVTRLGNRYLTPKVPAIHAIVNPKGGDVNCRACAIALDHLLGGKPASALPNIKAGTGAPIERLYGKRFHNRSLSNIASDIEKSGHGARGIVIGTRRDKAGREITSHAFNVTNRRGNVVFLDGQTGHANHVKFWTTYVFMQTR